MPNHIAEFKWPCDVVGATPIGIGGYVGSSRVESTLHGDESTSFTGIDGKMIQHLKRLARKDPTTKMAIKEVNQKTHLEEKPQAVQTTVDPQNRYTTEDTGFVNCIAWTPDNSAFAVGWKIRGLTVWSVSGCCLMSTIRQVGLSSISSPVVKLNSDRKHESLIAGATTIHWD